MITLITGGARSGKSRRALAIMENRTDVGFIATAQAFDEEMRLRIVRHRAERPASWTTYEEPCDPAGVIASTNHAAYILDCVTMLVSNLLLREWDAKTGPKSAARFERSVMTQIDDLVAAARKCGADLCVVTNEAGMGIVPDNTLSRIYRDLLGKANTRIADSSDMLLLMVCGRSLCIPAS